MREGLHGAGAMDAVEAVLYKIRMLMY